MASGAGLQRNLASDAAIAHLHDGLAIDIQMIMPRCPAAHLPPDRSVHSQTQAQQPVLPLVIQLLTDDGRQGNGISVENGREEVDTVVVLVESGQRALVRDLLTQIRDVGAKAVVQDTDPVIRVVRHHGELQVGSEQSVAHIQLSDRSVLQVEPWLVWMQHQEDDEDHEQNDEEEQQ